MMRHFAPCAMVVCAIMVASSATCRATSIHAASGLSAEGEAVSVRAELTISGDLLTVELKNTSTATTSPSGLLCSYYFDIIQGGNRPELELLSATGDVWKPFRKSADVMQESCADLVACQKHDGRWLFEDFSDTSGAFNGFGVSTVGNSGLSPINFNGSIVGGMDYGIYVGDVTTQNLSKRLLVNDSVTFLFSGMTGFTEADISQQAMFGLGTEPDTILTPPSEIPPVGIIPEPLTMALLGLGLVSAGGYVKKRIPAGR